MELLNHIKSSKNEGSSCAISKMSTTVVIVSPVSPTLLSNEVYVAVGPNMKSELQSIVENHPINEIKCMGG